MHEQDPDQFAEPAHNIDNLLKCLEVDERLSTPEFEVMPVASLLMDIDCSHGDDRTVSPGVRSVDIKMQNNHPACVSWCLHQQPPSIVICTRTSR